MLKGLNQWCFTADTPIEEVFAISADAGYDSVELNVYAPGGIGLTMDSTRSDAEAIMTLANRHGVAIPSLSTGLLWGSPLSSADESVRAEGRKVVEKQLELAEWMGADTVLVVPGVVDKDTSYDQCYVRSQNELKQLMEVAEKRKIKIGVENVWNKFLLSPLEMARYVDELDSPYASVYFDVGNILLYGFPEQWIHILGSRISKVHVKDFRPAIGNGQGFVSLLAGDVNWHAVREALQSIGYEGPLTAELGQYVADATQLVYDTSRHLDIILGGAAK